MREQFRGYYRPSETTFKKLWQDAAFSVDANVLLGLFRYSEETGLALLKALQTVEDRLWVSHQAALEYHRGLPGLLADEAKKCVEALAELTKFTIDLERPRNHPHVSAKALRRFKSAVKVVSDEIEKTQKRLFASLMEHPMKEKVATLLSGRVGAPYSRQEAEKLYADGKERYARRQPPGFADDKKADPELRYGDLVMWRQLLDQGKKTSRSMILVTDDGKEDWFSEKAGRTLGPHPDLIAEYHMEAGGSFYAYSVTQFLEQANTRLNALVAKTVIAETENSRTNPRDFHRYPAELLGHLLHPQADPATVSDAVSVALMVLKNQQRNGSLQQEFDDPSRASDIHGATDMNQQLLDATIHQMNLLRNRRQISLAEVNLAQARLQAARDVEARLAAARDVEVRLQAARDVEAELQATRAAEASLHAARDAEARLATVYSKRPRRDAPPSPDKAQKQGSGSEGEE